MKIKTLVILGLLQITVLVGAQEVERPEIKPVRYYFGVQPGLMPVLFESYDGASKYAWDINLVPLTMEYAVNRNWAIRVHTICDLEVRPDNFPAVMSAWGIEISAPYYLSLKNSEEGHRGFHIGPVLTPGYNLLNKYNSLKLGGMAGFSLLFGNRWSFGIGVQAGYELQKYPNNRFTRYVFYNVPALALGIWL